MKQEGPKAPIFDRNSTLVDVHSAIITGATGEISLDREAFPQFSAIIQPLLDQILPLTKNLETQLEEHGVGYPDRGMNDTHAIEDQMLELIQYIGKLTHSIGSILDKNSYSPHTKYSEQGVLVSDKTRHDLEPAIQIRFTPVNLQQFNSIDADNLGLSQVDLHKSEGQAIQESRLSAERASARLAELINKAMRGWTRDIAQASSRGNQPGISFKFGRVGKNGFEPNQNMQIELRLEIRHSPREGLHYLPTLHFSNPEIRERNLDISSEGEPVAITQDSSPNQETANSLMNSKELDKLGIRI